MFAHMVKFALSGVVVSVIMSPVVDVEWTSCVAAGKNSPTLGGRLKEPESTLEIPYLTSVKDIAVESPADPQILTEFTTYRANVEVLPNNCLAIRSFMVEYETLATPAEEVSVSNKLMVLFIVPLIVGGSIGRFVRETGTLREVELRDFCCERGFLRRV